MTKNWLYSILGSAGPLAIMGAGGAVLYYLAWQGLYFNMSADSLKEIGQLEREAGSVRVRSYQKTAWRTLASASEAVGEGDSVFTGTDGVAGIKLKDGRTLARVSPNSLVVIKREPDGFPQLDIRQGTVEVAQNTLTRPLQIEFRGQKFKVESQSGKPSTGKFMLKVDKSKGLSIKASEGADVVIKRIDKGKEIEIGKTTTDREPAEVKVDEPVQSMQAEVFVPEPPENGPDSSSFSDVERATASMDAGVNTLELGSQTVDLGPMKPLEPEPVAIVAQETIPTPEPLYSPEPAPEPTFEPVLEEEPPPAEPSPIPQASPEPESLPDPPKPKKHYLQFSTVPGLTAVTAGDATNGGTAALMSKVRLLSGVSWTALWGESWGTRARLSADYMIFGTPTGATLTPLSFLSTGASGTFVLLPSGSTELEFGAGYLQTPYLIGIKQGEVTFGQSYIPHALVGFESSFFGSKSFGGGIKAAGAYGLASTVNSISTKGSITGKGGIFFRKESPTGTRYQADILGGYSKQDTTLSTQKRMDIGVQLSIEIPLNKPSEER